MSGRPLVEIIECAAGRPVISPPSVYRYLGLGRTAPDPSLQELTRQSIRDFEAAVRYRACRLTVPLTVEDDAVDFGVFSVVSKSLARNLSGCGRAILFAATTGAEGERLLKRTAVTSPAGAVVLDAVGTAAIEAFCDLLCDRWRKELTGYFLRPRFSPGYGDLPLEVQKPLLRCLDSSRKAGITLTESLLMIPQKSVSAMVGIGKTGCDSGLDDCARCNKPDCAFRR